MRDLVSILVPAYNSAEWLSETITCVLKQTWTAKEIIIVDDGSTDDSLAIARSFKKRGVRIISQENKGACAARNRALAEANGDYIQFLDADDLMARNKIEVQVRRLKKEPEGTIAAAKWERFYNDPGEADLEAINFREKPYYGDRSEGIEWALDAAAHRAMMPSHSWLVPREVVEKAGPWNESLLINQDGEYFNRISIASSGVAFCPKARVYYRSGIENSVSNRKEPAALASKYRSVKCITEQLLAAENSQRSRLASAIAFQRCAYSVYPKMPDIAEKALKQAKKLGGAPSYYPKGSKAYQILHDVLGWRKAKWLRHWYYRIRYDKEI